MELPRRPLSLVRLTRLVLLTALLPLAACADRGPGGETGGETGGEEIALGQREWLGGVCHQINDVRELADGSLLVSDEYNGLLHVSAGSDPIRTIGGKGEGPGEYQRIMGLFELPGDSTAVYDDEMGRMLFLHGDRLLDRIEPVAGYTGGIDALGNSFLIDFLRSERSPGKEGSELLTERVAVLLAPRDGAAADTIGTFRNGVTAVVREGNTVHLYQNHVSAVEPALLFEDGWIAIAHPDPYRIDWRTPTGEWRQGTPIPYEPIPANPRELVTSFSRYRRDGFGMPAGTWEPQSAFDRSSRYFNWPETLPAFMQTAVPYPGGGLVAAPDGRVLVRRTQPADSTWVRYDVIDRRGEGTGYLRIEPREEIVASGAESLFLVATDSMDCQRVARVAWPG